MFDRLMALVNRIRALGNTEWDDNKVARKMLRTYRAKNNMLASVIMERAGYDEMTPQEVLSKLKHHECLDEDATMLTIKILMQWDTTRVQPLKQLNNMKVKV